MRFLRLVSRALTRAGEAEMVANLANALMRAPDYGDPRGVFGVPHNGQPPIDIHD